MAKKKDEGHEETESVLAKLEKEITEEYEIAEKEIEEKLNDYLSRFQKKDALKQKALANGKITQAEYNQWRVGQIAIGQRWEEMKDTIATDLTNTAEIAKSTAYGYMPEVYAINHNYGTFQVEKCSLIDTSYTLYDAQSVETLFQGGTFYHAPGKKVTEAINTGKQLAWDKRQVQSVMTQALLQGESIGKIATRLSKTVGDSDRKACIRNARTMTTGVENAGRVASYKRAENMGIKLMQEWLATLDSRTRHEHRLLDGQRVSVGEVFVVDGYEIAFPGDPTAEAHLVYNCRCTLVPVLKGFEVESEDLSLRHNDNLKEETYSEWKSEKESESHPITKQDSIEQTMKKKYNDEYAEYASGKKLGNSKSTDLGIAVKEVKSGGHVSSNTIDNIWVNKTVSKTDLMSAETNVDKKIAKTYVDNIEAWSGNYYKGIRKYQRGEINDDEVNSTLSKDSKLIEEYISKSVKWSGGTTYRVVDLEDDVLKSYYEKKESSSTIDMLGTSSWTSDFSYTEEKSIDYNKVIFVSETQSKGTSIMAYSVNPYEYEVIVSKDAKYKIVDITKLGDATLIYVEE